MQFEEQINKLTKWNLSKKQNPSLVEKIFLNPAILILIVITLLLSTTFNSKNTISDAEISLSNSMVYFERGDFDNAALQLSSIINQYPRSSQAVQASFYLGRISFINGENEEAISYLVSSAGKLDYDVLNKEAFLILGQIDPISKQAIKHFDSALRFTNSENEIAFITIHKAKRLAQDGSIIEAMSVLDSLDISDISYREFFEEVYGYIVSLS
jgi:tetratricopeptide (TPR) repeat protein